MLRQCNVLNVVEVGSTDAETEHTREQDCRTVNNAYANRITTVCSDAMTRKSTLSQEVPLSPAVPKPSEQLNSTKSGQGKRSTDLSDLSLNQMAGWRGKVRNVFRVKSRLALVSQVSTFRPQAPATLMVT